MAITPLDNDFALSAVYLGGVRSPGVVTLSGHDREPKWDIQAAYGSTGASTVLHDHSPPVQFEASFYLAEDGEITDGSDDFSQWESFQRLIESTTAKPKPTALPIYHPDLARNGITYVSNAGIGGMVHDGKGGATVKVKFLEFRPPKPRPATKPIAKPANTPTKPDPNASAKAELAALLAKAREP